MGWMNNRWYRACIFAAWTGAVLLLPITSMPLVRKITGADTVAPPSVLIFLLLFAVWLLPHFFTDGKSPLESIPLIIFVVVATVSWALSFFRPVLPYKTHLVSAEFVETFATIAMAVAVYLVTMNWASKNKRQFTWLIKLVNWSGMLLIGWTLAQVWVVLVLDGEYPRFMVQMQDLVSSREGTILFTDRVTGMAYEPSWLAHQLVMVYLPYWFAASLGGYSVFRKMKGTISVENILFLGGLGILFLSFSRIGWVSFLLMVGLVVINVNNLLVRKFRQFFKNRYTGKHDTLFGWISSIVVMLGLGAVYISLVAGLIWMGSKLEPRLAKILTYDLSAATSLYDLTNRLFFAERAVYWSAGWRVFGEHPIMGVGLGNVGFFFQEAMPAFGYGLPEIQNLFYRLTFLPNVKSMWVRLFAETGLVGTAVFLTWLFINYQSSRLVQKVGGRAFKTFGLMGQLVLVAFVSEGFSLDSFAMPYFWFTLGIIGAAAAITRREMETDQIASRGAV
jgi:hypothetical protein